MTNRIITILAAIGFTLFALIAALIIAVFSYFPSTQTNIVETNPVSVSEVENRPTLTSTEVPTVAATAASEPSATQQSVLTTDIAPPPIEETTGNPNQESLCGELAPTNLLLIVVDSGNGTASSGAQMIRLIQADIDPANFLVVPFSAYLEIPTPAFFESYGIQQTSLGSVYGSVQQSVTGANGHSEASQAIVQAISDYFEISAEHHFTLNETFLLRLSQWLGPIPIDNPGAFSTRQFEYPRGAILLTEENIWDYLVYSEGTVDEYFRLMRQDIVLKAIFDNIQVQFSPLEFETWLANLAEPMITDLAPSDFANLICMYNQANSASEENDRFVRLPYNIFELTLEKMIVNDLNQATLFLKELLPSI